MITVTYEPIRPIYCKSDHDAEYYFDALGTGRVFYGESHWPSRSYTVWVWQNDLDYQRHRVRVHIRTVGSKREVLKLSI